MADSLHLFQAFGDERAALETILAQGTLARRLRRALALPSERPPVRDALSEVYRSLADCLRTGRPFRVR